MDGLLDRRYENILELNVAATASSTFLESSPHSGLISDRLQLSILKSTPTTQQHVLLRSTAIRQQVPTGSGGCTSQNVQRRSLASNEVRIDHDYKGFLRQLREGYLSHERRTRCCPGSCRRRRFSLAQASLERDATHPRRRAQPVRLLRREAHTTLTSHGHTIPPRGTKARHSAESIRFTCQAGCVQHYRSYLPMSTWLPCLSID